MWSSARRSAAAVGAAVLSAAVVGIPTDVIDTGLFTRMTPVRWWEYPVLAVTAVLAGMWVVIPKPVGDVRGRGGVLGAVTGAVFAVGCPICNKIIVGLLGVSGALGVWAPVQPVLAVLSLAALGTAVAVRWRRRTCVTSTCAPATTPATADQPTVAIAPDRHIQSGPDLSPSQSVVSVPGG